MLALNFYRAATQSLTTDEAYTWQLYLSQNLRAILTKFDANNHVLFTLLSWLSVHAFGHAEWAIRLPSVLGSGLYVLAAWRLTGGRFLWTAALCLNPLIMDFMSAGRGYGPATALFLLALDLLLRGRLTRAGVAAGLSLAANLSLAFPITATALVVAWQRRRELWRLIDRFALPAVVTAFVFLAVPLAWSQPGAFYVGAESLEIGARTLFIASFGRDFSWTPWVIAVGLGLGAARAGVFGAIFWATVGVHVAAHYLAGFRYPEYRIGLYLIPLAMLAIMRAVRHHWAVALAFFAIYAVQLRLDHYLEWAYNRNLRETLQRLDREVGDKRPKQVAVTWVLEPSVNYYRERLRLDWMKPVDRRDPDTEADYYLLLEDHHPIIKKRNLRLLWHDWETGISVAAATPRPPPSPRGPA